MSSQPSLRVRETRAPVSARVAPEIDAERRRLYHAGHSDQEIARRVGVDRTSIRAWRHMRALPARNAVKGNNPAKRMLLYQLGWSDGAISRHEGSLDSNVQAWRARRNLPPNYAPGENGLHIRRPSLEDVFARVRRAVGRGLPRDIADDAVMDLCTALLDGTIPLADIERKARRYGNRVLDRFASRFGPRSLDEELGDDGDGFRMVDLIRDDRSSAWLEAMGATVF